MKEDHKLGSTFKNIAICLVYLAMIVYTGAFSLFGGISNYLVRQAAASNSIADCSSAVRYDPDNYEAYQTRSRLQAEAGNIPDGISDLRAAAELRPANYRFWMALGDLYSLSGDTANARLAFSRSIELAPHYISPKMLAGRYLLKQGDLHEAFQQLNMAANKDEGLYSEVLDLAKASLGQGISFDEAIQPGSTEAKITVAMYVIQNRLTSPSTEMFLTGDEITDGTKSGFTSKLLESGNFGLAYRVWMSKSTNRHYSDHTSKNVLVNGGFEDGIDPLNRGFGWVVDQNASNVQVRSIGKISSEGSNSVEVEFRGNSAAAAPVLSQLVLLKPNLQYRLTFDAYLEDQFISGGLPQVIVTDAETSGVNAGSTQIQPPAGKWTGYGVSFRTGAQQTAAIIKLRRLECPAATCPAFGLIRFDNFVLMPIE